MTKLCITDLSALSAQIAVLKRSGITDIALTEGSSSHVRGPSGTTFLSSPSRRELETLCEAVFGESKVALLCLGGKQFGSWNGWRVTAIVFRKARPINVGLRLDK